MRSRLGRRWQVRPRARAMLFSMGKPSAPSPQPSPARGEGASIRQFPQGPDIMTQPLQPLPVGINSLRMVIENGMTYVDKTRFAYELARLPGRYFLSRPRRFGKSLFLDTLQGAVRGQRALCSGVSGHPRALGLVPPPPGDPARLRRWGGAEPGGARSASIHVSCWPGIERRLGLTWRGQKRGGRPRRAHHPRPRGQRAAHRRPGGRIRQAHPRQHRPAGAGRGAARRA
jgi:hypothetical protein